MSANSISSQWCNWELGEVVRLNKRLIPVKIRDIAPETLPQTIGKIHLLPAEGVFSIDRYLGVLVEVLNTDRAWITESTRLADRAREWLDTHRAGAMLLRGEEIKVAEEWKDRQPKAAPAPSRDILELILASRRAATKRGRHWLIGSVAMAVIGFGLAGLAYWQRDIAIENEALAVANDKAANNERVENLKSGSRLVAVAAHQLIDENRPGLAQAVALEGLPERVGDRPMVDDALKALKRGIRADRSLAVLTLGKEEFLCAAFTPDGKTLVTGTNSGKLVVWNLQTYQPRFQIQTGNQALFQIDISPDGRKVLAASDHQPEVWDLTTGQILLQLPPTAIGFARKGLFSPDGTRIAIGYSDNHAEIRDAATGALLHRLDGPKDFDEGYARRAGPKANAGGDDPIAKATAEGSWRMLGGMTEVLFSPDGKFLAIAGQADAEAAARLYDVATGELLATLPGENLVMSLSLQRMSFSPDGARLALASADNVVRVWSVPAGKLLFELPHTAESHALTFDPTGAFLFVGYADGSIRTWGGADGQIVATFAAHLDRVSAIAFAPDGRDFATASVDRNIGVWWDTLEPDSCGPADKALFCDTHLHSAAVLRGHTDKIVLVLFSPDGKTLASIAADSTLRIWRTEIAGMVSLQSPPEPSAAEESCDEPAPDPPPESAADDQDNPAPKLSEEEVRKMATKYGLGDDANTLAIGPLVKELKARIADALAGLNAAAHDACQFSKVMGGLAGRDGHDAHILSRVANQMERSVELPNGTDDDYRIVFADDGKHLLAPNGGDAGFKLWDLGTGQALCEVQGRHLAPRTAGGTVMVYATPFAATPARCQPAGAAQNDQFDSDIANNSPWMMSPDGTRAVGSSEWLDPRKDGEPVTAEKRMLIDVINKKAVAELAVDGRGAKTALFSADGTTVIGALAGDLKKGIPDGTQYAVWDASTGSLRGVTAPNNGVLNHLGVASDGRRFVLAEDGGSTVTYYFIDDGGHLASRVMAGPSRDLSTVAISSDGTTVAAAYIDGSIAFFSSHDGKLAATLPAGIYPVTHLVFSPDAGLLAGSDTNRTVWLWDVASKTPVVVTSARNEPTALKFSPAGDRLAFRTDTGEVRVLTAGLDYLGLDQPQDVVDWARASLSATLSETDRQRFLLGGQRNRKSDQNVMKLISVSAPPPPAAAGTAAAAPANESPSSAAADRPDPSALREKAAQTALAAGLPGASQALKYALSGDASQPANATFQLGLDIDHGAASEAARELAFFYLKLGQRFAEASPAGAVDDGLRDAATARLQILPRQIPPRVLVELFRSARNWQAP